MGGVPECQSFDRSRDLKNKVSAVVESYRGRDGSPSESRSLVYSRSASRKSQSTFSLKMRFKLSRSKQSFDLKSNSSGKV